MADGSGLENEGGLIDTLLDKAEKESSNLSLEQLTARKWYARIRNRDEYWRKVRTDYTHLARSVVKNFKKMDVSEVPIEQIDVDILSYELESEMLQKRANWLTYYVALLVAVGFAPASALFKDIVPIEDTFVYFFILAAMFLFYIFIERDNILRRVTKNTIRIKLLLILQKQIVGKRE